MCICINMYRVIVEEDKNTSLGPQTGASWRCAKEDGSARAGKQYKAQKGEVIFDDQELPGRKMSEIYGNLSFRREVNFWLLKRCHFLAIPWRCYASCSCDLSFFVANSCYLVCRFFVSFLLGRCPNIWNIVVFRVFFMFLSFLSFCSLAFAAQKKDRTWWNNNTSKWENDDNNDARMTDNMTNKYWLVVWNVFSFPCIENNHPNWLSYFFRGVAQPPVEMSRFCRSVTHRSSRPATPPRDPLIPRVNRGGSVQQPPGRFW